MRRCLALFLLLGLACQACASDATTRLLQLLVAKKVISQAEAGALFGAGDVDSRLASLLERKGVLTRDELQELQRPAGRGSAPALQVSWSEGGREPAARSAGGYAVPAGPSQPAAQQPPAEQRLQAAPDFGPGEIGPTARAAVPRPVEVLPLSPLFAPGPLTVRLGSAATVSPYGMIKASVVHDSNLSSGDDFPFFGRVVGAGPETANSTGTLTRPPDFRVKARSARLGLDIYAPDPNERFTVTGKFEFDFEGSFPSATNRNIAAIRSSEASIRLAWVRLDTRAAGLPVFLKFGQDASLFGSTTQPTGLETTGNYLWQGNVNERAPGVVTGARFDFGGGWQARLATEAGIFLPSGGEYVAEIAGSPRWGSPIGSVFSNNNPAPEQGTTGFGQREGTNSGRPRTEGRVVLEFEPWRARRIPPSQIVGSFQFGDRVRYFAPPFQTAGRNFQLRSNSNGYTGEFRLATPWWTLLGKYYRGSDLRFYFGGLAQDTFYDGGDPFTQASGAVTLRPVRSQGGFAQLQLPLSVWFDPANPRLHGFSLNLMTGYDSAFARDARRSGQRRAQGALMGNLLYQYNRFLQFGFETDFIQTFYTSPQGGVTDATTGVVTGPRGKVGKNLRLEFGTVFTF